MDAFRSLSLVVLSTDMVRRCLGAASPALLLCVHFLEALCVFQISQKAASPNGLSKLVLSICMATTKKATSYVGGFLFQIMIVFIFANDIQLMITIPLVINIFPLFQKTGYLCVILVQPNQCCFLDLVYCITQRLSVI